MRVIRYSQLSIICGNGRGTTAQNPWIYKNHKILYLKYLFWCKVMKVNKLSYSRPYSIIIHMIMKELQQCGTTCAGT